MAIVKRDAWLANLGNEPGVQAASVTIETAPDHRLRLRREVETNIDPDAPAFAKAMLHEVVRDYPLGSSVINAYVAISFSSASATLVLPRKPRRFWPTLAGCG